MLLTNKQLRRLFLNNYYLKIRILFIYFSTVIITYLSRNIYDVMFVTFLHFIIVFNCFNIRFKYNGFLYAEPSYLEINNTNMSKPKDRFTGWLIYFIGHIIYFKLFIFIVNQLIETYFSLDRAFSKALELCNIKKNVTSTNLDEIVHQDNLFGLLLILVILVNLLCYLCKYINGDKIISIPACKFNYLNTYKRCYLTGKRFLVPIILFLVHPFLIYLAFIKILNITDIICITGILSIYNFFPPQLLFGTDLIKSYNIYIGSGNT